MLPGLLCSICNWLSYKKASFVFCLILSSYLYKTESVCQSVSLFCMCGHSFEQICTKFGLWHPYTLRMVMGR